MPGSTPNAASGRAPDAHDDGGGRRSDAELAAELWSAGDDDLRTALARAERLVDAAAAASDAGAAPTVGVARLRTTLGHLLIRSVQPTRAERELRAAATDLEALGDRPWLARCLGRLALLQMTTGAAEVGLRTGQQAVALALAEGVPGVAVVTLANMGAALLDMGDPLGAIEHLAEALSMADDADRRADVALVLANLAEAFQTVGDLASAERYAELAVVTADQDTAGSARLVGRLVLAGTYQARGEHEAAAAMAAEAEQLCVDTGLAIARPQALLIRMASLRALGRPAEAVAAADAVSVATGDEPSFGLRSVLRERLLANLDLGVHDAVHTDAAAVLAYADTHSPLRSVAHEALAEVARRTDDHQAEAVHLRAALEAVRAAHHEETKRRNLAIRSRAEVARAELDAAEHRRRTNQLQRALDAVERDRADLLAVDATRTHLIAHLEQLADEDPLTGLPNRRRMERAVRDAPHYLPAASSFALIDVDHFKQVNDRYGHMVGDRVLARLARMFTKGTRPTDLVGRVGGEEFAVLLADDVDHTVAALERLRGVVADEQWGDLAPGLLVTVSIGVVPFQPGETLGAALQRADGPLYEAKRAGRNRVAFGP